jgi:hypothetical protein
MFERRLAIRHFTNLRHHDVAIDEAGIRPRLPDVAMDRSNVAATLPACMPGRMSACSMTSALVETFGPILMSHSNKSPHSDLHGSIHRSDALRQTTLTSTSAPTTLENSMNGRFIRIASLRTSWLSFR